MQFDDIEYLKHGNPRQQRAYTTLSDNKILLILARFDPILVGTIPINIDVANSDLDIICCFSDDADFRRTISENFGSEKGFRMRERPDANETSVVANFVCGDFEIEIFGQNVPTKRQLAYRHMVIEHALLNARGQEFRKRIVELKRRGLKTEPAFALALGLSGDPYLALLQFETSA